MNDRERKLFEQWFFELEAFSLRAERFYDTLASLDQSDNLTMKGRIVKGWLEAAFEVGYQRGVEDTLEEYKEDD